MNIKDLVPAYQCAANMGVKAVLYGEPGIGKTPLINTAPNPVLLAIEPGMLSMRGSSVLTYKAYEHREGTHKGVDEFFEWWFKSNEPKKFDTLGIDSGSEMAEAYLRFFLPKHAHGMKAYGEMSLAVMKHFTPLYYQQCKHIVIITKQFEDVASGRKKPSFPGNDLNIKVPHFFDEILHYAKVAPGTIPGVLEEVKAIRTYGTAQIMARDRSGQLNEFEQPDLTQIFKKCMAA